MLSLSLLSNGGGYDAMRETGIPLVPHLGYKEMTPLGQAEWIKFIGMIHRSGSRGECPILPG